MTMMTKHNVSPCKISGLVPSARVIMSHQLSTQDVMQQMMSISLGTLLVACVQQCCEKLCSAGCIRTCKGESLTPASRVYSMVTRLPVWR
jgi:hypothetical protein